MIRFVCSAAVATTLSCLGSASAAPPVIDDQEILETLRAKAGEFADKGGHPRADDLAAKIKTGPRLSPAGLVPLPSPVPTNSYEELSKSVFLIGSVYKCGKCNHWHRGGTATAWCLTADGLMVTNAHVFKNAKGGAMAAVDRANQAYPITDLVAFDLGTDVAIFRIQAENLSPLPIGQTAEVGADVTVISHPQGHHFIRTEGSVSRYWKRPMGKNQPKTVWMSISADYAKGSSGGPVFNAAGEVVGMVSSTQSIHTGPDPGNPKDTSKGDLQMVIHDCVPVDSIRSLLAEGKPQAAN